MTGEQDTDKAGDQVKSARGTDRTSESITKDSNLGQEKHQELYQNAKQTENQSTLSDQALMTPLPGESLEQFTKRVEDIQANRFGLAGELTPEDTGGKTMVDESTKYGTKRDAKQTIGQEILAAAQKPNAHSLAAYDANDVIAQNPFQPQSGPISDGTNATDQHKPKDAKESATIADLRKTVDAIRDSGILTAPGRTGGGDVEYKMVIFKDGSHTKAYKNKSIGKDPLTHSDVYATDPELSKQILLASLRFNPPAKLLHSHPNKAGMDPYAFSKEDIVESNSANADSYLLGPDGRLFVHKANFQGRLMDTANITNEMRIPDKVVGRFDAEGKFHRAIYEGKNVTFEPDAF